MDRDWIMHPALNSPFVEKRNNLIPFLDPDRMPVISKNAQLFLQSWVVGRNRARFTKRAKVLARVKAKTSGITKCASTSASVFASVGLGCVLDDGEIMVPRELKNWIHVGRLAE